MSMQLIGRKCGMTRVFTEAGVSIPVTVVEILPNRVSQVKTIETDGYRALQLAVFEQKSSRVNKPIAGHFLKAGILAAKMLHECRLAADEYTDAKVSDEFKVDLFSEGQKVDVRGLSRGKGFAGTVKRHNFRTQDATHGNSLSHRAPGSIGQNSKPGRVLKGKKMAGQLGNEYCTVQNQQIIKIDVERNLMLIKGGLPGAPNGIVIIKKSVKTGGNS